jgi:hypothetical protein
MSIELTEEQSQLLKELRLIDLEPPYKGFAEAPSSTHSIPPSESEAPDVELLYDVDYDSEHARIREKLMRYRKKS